MEIISLILDVVLVGAGLWMAFIVRQIKLGGTLGRTINQVMIGAVILGIAHIFETISFQWLQWSIELTELTHRIIVLLGFGLLILGFQQLTKLRE